MFLGFDRPVPGPTLSKPLIFSGGVDGVSPSSHDVRLVLDGAWISDHNQAGVAWVFSDARSHFPLGGGAQACIVDSAIHAELKACILGLRSALQKGFSSLLIFTDFSLVVRFLQRLMVPPVSVSWSLAEVRRLLACLRDFSVCKVPRPLVEQAHNLAGRARRRQLLSISF